jgi:uncharacterized protein involved in exopolysaccharide biosynthesis
MTQQYASKDYSASQPGVIRLAPRRPPQVQKQVSTTLFGRIILKRTLWKELSLERFVKGGRIADTGRLGRYAIIIAAGLAFSWGPAITYLKFGLPSYTSHFSLILPGSGASSSINLSDIGQASSAASSAFSGSSISPTVTYKNLLLSSNVVLAAASVLKENPQTFPAPTIKLVDETSFIAVEMSGSTPEQARDRANAVQSAFFSELSKLRLDETKRRNDATFETVNQYERAVNDVRDRISSLQVKSALNSSEQFNTMVSAADVLQNRVTDSEAELAKVVQAKKSLAASLQLNEHNAAITLKLHADPVFGALIESTSKAEAEYASTSRQYGTNHPKVIDAYARLDGARTEMLIRASVITGFSRQKLAGKIDFSPAGQRSNQVLQLVAFETEKQGLQGQLRSMKSALAVMRLKIASTVGVAAELDRLNSEHKVAEAVFASALARISTSKADIFASYPLAQISEAAVAPLTPTTPNKKIAFGAAATSTILLLFGLLLAWVRRSMIDKLLNLANKTDESKKPS